LRRGRKRSEDERRGRGEKEKRGKQY
jgi:hypothetical protein